MRPVCVIVCLRKVPSSVAPNRKIAALERRFSKSVFNSTRLQFQASKACLSIRNFVSVLTNERCHSRPIHVQPISTREFSTLIEPKRVEPTALLEDFSIVANGKE